MTPFFAPAFAYETWYTKLLFGKTNSCVLFLFVYSEFQVPVIFLPFCPSFVERSWRTRHLSVNAMQPSVIVAMGMLAMHPTVAFISPLSHNLASISPSSSSSSLSSAIKPIHHSLVNHSHKNTNNNNNQVSGSRTEVVFSHARMQPSEENGGVGVNAVSFDALVELACQKKEEFVRIVLDMEVSLRSFVTHYLLLIETQSPP